LRNKKGYRISGGNRKYWVLHYEERYRIWMSLKGCPSDGLSD